MIQIDDAGSGSLVGGTCIGAMRVETKEFYYDIIPLEYYSKHNFKNKKYLDYVVVIIKEIFNKLDVKKNEVINVCRGYMFDMLREWLEKKEYKYNNVKIIDPLQSKIENAFENYAISLGLPKDYIKYTKYPFHFHRILRWVYADYKNRKKLCKRGWKSWQKYKNLKTKTNYESLSKSNYICFKCGKPIDNNSIVKKITYTTNKKYYIYLHKDC